MIFYFFDRILLPIKNQYLVLYWVPVPISMYHSLDYISNPKQSEHGTACSPRNLPSLH